MLTYYRGDPLEHILLFQQGKIVRKGNGISFFYWPSRTTVVSIPLNTADLDFVFNEITASFQAVTVQGQATYRVVDPEKLAALLDHSVHPDGKSHRTRDPAKLPARLVLLIQEAARAEIQRLSLEDTLRQGASLARAILGRVAASPEVAALGVEVLGVFVNAVRPTPEVARALEAGYREALLKQADHAIHDRRAAVVEQERKIRENELGTDILLEQERARLVELQAENRTKEAESQARALEAQIAPWRAMDPRTVLALAFKALGENASKIGNLTITPDLLTAMLKGTAG
jgi:hypothetical protein